MSYARRGPNSDVYVFDAGDCYVCHECRLMPIDKTEEWLYQHFACHTPGGMLAHLARHTLEDHKVPAAALERLREEIRKGTKT